MAEYGEWVRKGAVLSEVTAQKEYGVTRDFIVEAIQAGKLEFREGAVWGNPYLKILRSQLEVYIAEKFGSEYLVRTKARSELRTINKEIAHLKKKLSNCPHLRRERPRLSGRRLRSGLGVCGFAADTTPRGPVHVWNPNDAVVSIDMTEPLAIRIPDLGWHVQLHASGDRDRSTMRRCGTGCPAPS